MPGSLRRRVALLGLLLPVASSVAHAQDHVTLPPARWIERSADWEIAVGYPEAVSVGGGVAIGRSRLKSIPGRGFLFRGVEVAANAGLGAGSARISWADYFSYDAGRDGWSVDVVVIKPWMRAWAPGPGQVYVGAGASHRLNYLRLSGALVRSVTGRHSRLLPVIQASLWMPSP